MEKTKQVFNYLIKNPLLSVREISDNALDVKINYNTTRKIIRELISQKKIAELLEYYYVIPTVNKEIQFLIKITNVDKILKPEFKKIKNPNTTSENHPFQQIIKQYIRLVNLMLRIRLTELRIAKESDSLNKKYMKEVRNELKNYLRSFKVDENISDDDFHMYLLKHIEDKHFFEDNNYDDIKTRRRLLEERMEMLSVFLESGSVKEVSDQYGYKSNKTPRKILEKLFFPNGKLALDKLYLAEKSGKISKKQSGKLFSQWVLRLNALDLKTKRDRQKFKRNVKKFFNWDILEQGDFKSFDIS